MADEKKSHVPENWRKTAAIGHHLLICSTFTLGLDLGQNGSLTRQPGIFCPNQSPIHKT